MFGYWKIIYYLIEQNLFFDLIVRFVGKMLLFLNKFIRYNNENR